MAHVDFDGAPFVVRRAVAMVGFSHTIGLKMVQSGSSTEEDRRLAEARLALSRPSSGSRGAVASINVSFPGGVPKRPIDRTRITVSGLVGDGQRTKAPVHGGPDKAVCLFGLEQIRRVNADGHHLYPGAIGENLTVAGLELGGLAAGDALYLTANYTSGMLGAVLGGGTGGASGTFNAISGPANHRLIGGILRIDSPLVVTGGDCTAVTGCSIGTTTNCSTSSAVRPRSAGLGRSW